MGKHCGQHGERPDKKVGPGGDDHLKGGGGHDCLLGRAGHDGWKAAPDIVATVPASDPDAGGALTDALTDDAGGLSHSMTTVIGVSFANSGDDALSGGEGDDELDGGAGNDRLFCSMGNEVLAGGDGDDILSGSTGADRFVFHAADQDSTRSPTSGRATSWCSPGLQASPPGARPNTSAWSRAAAAPRSWWTWTVLPTAACSTRLRS